MASLLKIIAVSLGGGVALGAGIRLGEAMAAQFPPPGGDAAEQFTERLDELEVRLGPPASEVREELRGWIEETVTRRITEAETRLRTESQQGKKEMLDAFAAGVETRVMQRISRLEEQVAGQSAAVQELRECSLRTESSVQKLLGGIDRLIVKNTPAAAEQVQPEASAAASADAPLVPLPPFSSSERPRRWRLFG